jgi:hypothetical protein
VKNPRGVYEKEVGSGSWWIRYVDASGAYRRELAGAKSDAISLYHKRKAESLQGKKLPEKLRRRVVKFSELCDDAKRYTIANNEGHASDCYRIEKLRAEFGERPAGSIPIEVFRAWFDEQEWEPGTCNRMRTVLFSIYRLGIENRKVDTNPARILKRKKVSDDRVRFLSPEEESRLRAVIAHDYPRAYG